MVGVVGESKLRPRAVEVEGGAVTFGQELAGAVANAPRRLRGRIRDYVELRGELLEQRPGLRGRGGCKRGRLSLKVGLRMMAIVSNSAKRSASTAQNGMVT